MLHRLHIVCDFDGTVTQVDTLNYLSARFAPDVRTRLHGKLQSGELTLREIIALEIGTIDADPAEIVRVAVEEVPLRDGFVEFVAAVDDAGHELVIVSAGFHQLIEPMLQHAGVRDDLEVRANHVVFRSTGGVVTWREVPTCATCDSPCKRSDVVHMRSPDATVVFVGDGYSDRCGAEAADRVLARDGLADWLDGRGVSYEPFGDFRDVVEALGL